jgi:hypothetical protein
MRWHGRHVVIATAVAVAAAGNARADDLALPLGAAVLPQLTSALPSLPPAPIPTPLPSLPSVPLPKPPALPSLPAAPAPALPQQGPVPAAVPRHAAVRAPAPAASRTGGGASGTSVSRRAASSASSASRTGGRASGTGVSRRARSSARSASTPRGRARRREPSPRKLRRVLAPLAACVATLGPRQERVLVRRAGLRGFKGASRAETAASLHLTVRRVARLEHRALRTLRRKARAGACDAPAPAAAAMHAVAATGVGLSLPVPAAPTAAPRQEVKAVRESGGGNVDALAESAPKLRNVAPVAGAEAAVRAGRSYAAEHPFQFALAVLVSLLCALLLVRELRRD